MILKYFTKTCTKEKSKSKGKMLNVIFVKIHRKNHKGDLLVCAEDETFIILLGADFFNRSNNRFVNKKCPR